MGKKIVGAKSDNNGVTTHLKFGGNKGYTPIKTAVKMAERGEIDNAHAVNPSRGESFVRTNPDGRVGNNIDTLSGDK